MTCAKKKEAVLFRAAKLLNKSGIHYWITDGTLLGLIREQRLLPWDDDIDIGVLKCQVSRKHLIDIFTDEGFVYLDILPDMDSLHFEKENVQLDLNMYTVEDDRFYIKWAVYPEQFSKKLAIQIINVIFEDVNNINKKIADSDRGLGHVKALIRFAGRLLSSKVKEKMFDYARKKYIITGSVYPKCFMKVETFSYKNNLLNVPENSEEYLRLTYGIDWRIPKQKFNWTNDTCNLDRFD